jgi:rubrerythrin
MDSMKPFLLGAVQGFLLTVACLAAFYPLVRSLRRGKPALLVSGAILFLGFLALELLIENYISIADAISQLFGMALALWLVSSFFSKKSAWLSKLAISDGLSNNFKLGMQVRLREVLQMGIIMEEKGRQFYKKLASSSRSKKVKKICLDLANKEVEHKSLIEGILDRWLPVPMSRPSLSFFREEMKSRGIFTDPLPSETSEKDLLNYAISQEHRMEKFYQSFEEDFPSAWKRMHLERLVMEERSHASQLEDLLSEVLTAEQKSSST